AVQQNVRWRHCRSACNSLQAAAVDARGVRRIESTAGQGRARDDGEGEERSASAARSPRRRPVVGRANCPHDGGGARVSLRMAELERLVETFAAIPPGEEMPTQARQVVDG